MRAGWLALAFALLVATTPAAAQVIRIYEVKYRSAEELLPLAQTALDGEGRVAADRRTNALVFSGSREAVESALALLAALDVRARTVVLRYESRSAQDLASGGARVAWSADAGGLRIGNVEWAGAGAGVAVRLDDTGAARTGTLAGQLRILDGQTGRIVTGARVPITTRRAREGWSGPVVSESTHYVSADSGFEARPRVLRDGRIELALRPFDASIRPDGSVATSGADTTVVLQPGKTVALGGILRGATEQRTGALSGGGSAAAADESLLLVTAEIEP